jgi:hypothetical protein
MAHRLMALSLLVVDGADAARRREEWQLACEKSTAAKALLKQG